MIKIYGIPVILLILLRLSFSSANQQNQTKQCVVEIFYETLCYMSRQFMTKQLPQAQNALGDKLKLMPVPYGATQMTQKNGKTNMTCQHGPQECIGNKIQACAIYVLQNNNSAMMQMLSIFMNEPPPFSSNSNYSQSCSFNDTKKQQQFNDCMNSEKVNDLLAKYGNLTAAAKIPSIPYVIIDGISTSEMSQNAQTNLLQTCCDQLGIQMPKQCKQDCDHKNHTSS